MLAQDVRTLQRSRRSATTYDGQMATALVAIDLKDDRIAGLTMDADLRLCTRRAAWPALARLDAWLLVGLWTREVNLIRSPAAERVMGAMLIVPVDNEANLAFEMRLLLGWRDQPQDLLERSMEAFDYGDGINCPLHPICAMGSNPFK